MDTNIPQELVEQLSKGNCVLFVGGDVAQFPSLASYNQQLTVEIGRHLPAELHQCPLPLLVQRYRAEFGEHSLINKICEWAERQQPTPGSIENIIAGLPFEAIVTTRADTLLERSLRAAEKPVRPVVVDSDTSFTDKRHLTIVYMYGSVNAREELRLTEHSQLELFAKRPTLLTLLRYYGATKTLLLLGFNLRDPVWKVIHRQLVQEIGRFSRRAYAVQSEVDPYDIQDWLRDDNIQLIQDDAYTFLSRLREQHKRAGVLPNIALEPMSARRYDAPYKFLDYFRPEEEALFYGRTAESGRMSKLILANRLHVLFGTSGVGKTSFINAGLMPELTRLNAFSIYSRCLDSPLTALMRYISEAVENETGHPIQPNSNEEHHLLSLLIAAQQAVGKRLVIFIDQFEEFFRQPYDQQLAFITALARCLDTRRLDIRLVLSLRDDYFSELERWRSDLHTDPFQNVFRLEKLTEEQAQEAIQGPLQHFEVSFEPKLVKALLAELRSADGFAPAQIQIVCHRLYEKYADKIRIEVEDYMKLGGAAGILRAYLSQVLERNIVLPRQHLSRQILQALVTTHKTRQLLSGDAIAAFVRRPWADLEPITADLVNFHLVRRLETENGIKYELLHDYLAEEVWLWLTEDAIRIKEAQEIIEVETRYWPKYHEPISIQKLDAIYACWQSLAFSPASLELLCRSSYAHPRIKQWEAVAQKYRDEVVVIYSNLMLDQSFPYAHLLAVTLRQMGEGEKLTAILNEIDSYRKIGINRALNDHTHGRSMQDFKDEAADPQWSKRSLWNASSAVGIDFGTTASAVAVERDGKPVIIPNREGSKFTPSVVAFTKAGEVVVGTPALLQAVSNPTGTVFSVKRRLGTDWTIEANGTTYTAEDVAAYVFSCMKQDAEAYLGRAVTEAVITAPAYFDQAQRAALIRAAEKAGFKILRVIAEPTAAAVGYGLIQHYEQYVAVFDIGGGTFDISLLEFGLTDDGLIIEEMLAVGGNTALGGDDFDERVIDYLIAEFRQQYGIDLSADDVARVRLKEAAERAKITLSGLDSVSVFVPYIYADATGSVHLDVVLTRSTFDEITQDLLDAIRIACRDTLASYGAKYWRSASNQPTALVLVGLSTKIPSVRAAACEIFNLEPIRSVDPEEAVAMGAAIQAGVLSGSPSGEHNHLLHDVIPRSLGIETLGGVMTKLVDRNTTVPTRKSETFSTAEDGQTEVKVNFYEGERNIAAANKLLAQVELKGIPPAPRGIPQIEVTIDIDANSTVSITVRDKATGSEVKHTVAKHEVWQIPKQMANMPGSGLVVRDDKDSTK